MNRLLTLKVAALAALLAWGDTAWSQVTGVGGQNPPAQGVNPAPRPISRRQANDDYERQLRRKWREHKRQEAQEEPDRNVKPIDPIDMSDEDARRRKHDNRLPIHIIFKPIKRVKQPQPIQPIESDPQPQQPQPTQPKPQQPQQPQQPQPTEPQNPQPQPTEPQPTEPQPQPTEPLPIAEADSTLYIHFKYLNTPLKVRRPQCQQLVLKGNSEIAVANGWKALSGKAYNNTIADCLSLRTSMKLCDWAYLMMLQEVSKTYLGSGTDEATLFMAYIYCQSGYRMRLAVSEGNLEMLYASQHTVYGVTFYTVEGEKYVPMHKLAPMIRITPARFAGSQAMSLWVNENPAADFAASPERTLMSKRYPNIKVNIKTNENLMPFYTSYPTSEIGGNFMTRWAMYANTPVSPQVEGSLYPQLKSFISGMSQLDAVERLLNWVQTAFVYEFDNKVWGGDRAFFPDETLHYPYCDCEDRAILFTRLVRDLVGLKCVLIYYPGHLASAVHFTEEGVKGDYLTVDGTRYFVCDPTYIGAAVGCTMPRMDNETAAAIVLQ